MSPHDSVESQSLFHPARNPEHRKQFEVGVSPPEESRYIACLPHTEGCSTFPTVIGRHILYLLNFRVLTTERGTAGPRWTPAPPRPSALTAPRQLSVGDGALLRNPILRPCPAWGGGPAQTPWTLALSSLPRPHPLLLGRRVEGVEGGERLEVAGRTLPFLLTFSSQQILHSSWSQPPSSFRRKPFFLV